MRHNKNSAGRHFLTEPQLQQFTAQVFRRQHVERGEWFVHEQHFGFHHQRPRKPHPLLHAARKFLGIRRLKAIQAHRIQHAERPFAPLHRRHPPRFQRSFHVLQNRKPGKQRETLEDDRHVRRLTAQRLAVPEQRSRRRLRKPAQYAQQSGLAAARSAQQSNDFARLNDEVREPHHLNARPVRLGIRLLNRARFDNGFRRQNTLRNFYTRSRGGRKADCHPEQRVLCAAKDLREPRDESRPLRRNNRASGSLPLNTAFTIGGRRRRF